MTASKWSQKHKTSCERAEDAYTAAKPVSLRGSNAQSSHLCNSFQQKRNKRVRCVLRVLVTFPACSHQRPEHHAHCRVRDDGVPVLQVEPIRARLRQLRVVVQELEQDSDEVVTPRPPSIVDTSKNKSANSGKKGRLNVRSTAQKKKTTSVISKKVPPENSSPFGFKLVRKNKTALNYSHYGLMNSTNKKICTTHFCNYFCRDGMLTPSGKSSTGAVHLTCVSHRGHHTFFVSLCAHATADRRRQVRLKLVFRGRRVFRWCGFDGSWRHEAQRFPRSKQRWGPSAAARPKPMSHLPATYLPSVPPLFSSLPVRHLSHFAGLTAASEAPWAGLRTVTRAVANCILLVTLSLTR